MSHFRISNVSKQFEGRVQALENVSIEVSSGEIVAILGPSGSGKSTLLRCINGLCLPDQGSIEVGDLRVSRRSLRLIRRQVGMIFQKTSLIPRASVMMNVIIGRLGYRSWITNLLGWFPEADHQLVIQALTEVKLLDRMWDRADRLSGGQQQRVGIARAIVQQANLILADEPVSSLDPETSHEVLRLLVRVAMTHQSTLVVNLHKVDLALAYAHRIIGLRGGCIQFDLPVGQVNSEILDQLYRSEAVGSVAEERRIEAAC